MIYSAGGALFIMLIGVLVFFLRSGGNSSSSSEWENSNAPDFDERMLQKEDKVLPSIEPFESSMNSSTDSSEQVSPFDAYKAPQNENISPVGDMSDLFASSPPQSPPSALMGMIDTSGQEVIEYPAGSGIKWIRTDASQDWTQH